jgi:hypothetical protein
MDDTPTADQTSTAADRWRLVDIASPRSMAGRTYAMIAKRDGVEETIARDVTLAQALFVALEHRGGCLAAMVYRDRGDLREYVIGRRPTGTKTFEAVLRGAVPRTARIAVDHVRALEFFEEVLEHDARVFFDGRLERTRPRGTRRRNAVVGDTT